MKKLIAHHKKQHTQRVAKYQQSHALRVDEKIAQHKRELYAGMVGAGILGTVGGVLTGGAGVGFGAYTGALVGTMGASLLSKGGKRK